jgi:molybdopterin-binding protein
MFHTRSLMAILAVATLAALGTTTVAAQHGRPVGIPERARGADDVVVGTVVANSAAYETNQFGDQLIVSHTAIRVEETMKGEPRREVSVDIEGGTVNGITMRVSDMQALQVGDRAVFFMKRADSGVYVPHLRGNGILKLNARNGVDNTSLTLDRIRSMVQGAGR